MITGRDVIQTTFGQIDYPFEILIWYDMCCLRFELSEIRLNIAQAKDQLIVLLLIK